MADLRTRFRVLDTAPVPELWADIERRAASGAEPTTRVTGLGPVWRGPEPTPASRRLVLAFVLLGLLVITLLGASLVGARLLRPDRLRGDRAAPTVAAAVLQPIHIEDFSAEMAIPQSWQKVEGGPIEYQHFGGTEPEGHFSVGHESPYFTAVCTPDCEEITVEGTIPYSAPKQLAALREAVAGVAGSTEWTDLPPDVLPEVDGAARLDTTGPGPGGRDWHRVYVVGLRDRNLVALAWSQPADAYDEGLLARVLDGLTLPSAPVYSDGDLMDWPQDGAFAMPMPGLWLFDEQPSLDGAPLSGVRDFGPGQVSVSIGSPEGTLGWCDPDCRELSGQTSLDALEASVRAGEALGPAIEMTLGGEPARMMVAETAADRRVVIALHGGRPVAIRIDTAGFDVEPGVVDAMVAGFRFADPPAVAQPTQTFEMAGGRVQLGLSDAWSRAAPPNDDELRSLAQELKVHFGDKRDRIQTCERPAAPWELCREVRAQTLEALAAAVMPAPIADHGVGPPSGRQEAITVDGEPAIVTRIQAYEYPAQSGQEVVYIAVMHGGRPYLVRIWTHANEVTDLDAVIAGLRFVD